MSNRQWRVPFALAVVVSTAACGTRVDSSTPSASTVAPGVTAPAGGEPAAEARRDPAVAVAPVPVSAPVSSAGNGRTPGSKTSTEVPVSQPGRQSSPRPDQSSGSRTVPTGPVPGSGSKPTSPSVPAPNPAAGGGARSTVIVASVGTYSGPVGTVLLPVLNGAQLWVKYVNDHGGVNGHQIKLLVYDDGGDPARHRTQVQEANERQGVMAFLADGGGLTGQGSQDYITAQGIPVVGTDGGQTFAYSSPMYFPQMSNGTALFRTFVPSIAGQLIPNGKRKLGTLICVEGECDQVDKVVAETASGSGLNHVYRGRSSLAQPDFTAECLAARNQGAEILLIVLDQNSSGRVAAACTRQGYKPTYALVPQGLADRLKENSNLAETVASSPVFPYFFSGSPATAQFQTAFRQYGKGLELGVGVAMGWTAGKLFEKGAANLPEPPTRAALLQGLWSIKDDTLAGLTQPLTFTQGRPADPQSCWFDLQIDNKQWFSPDAGQLHCVR